MALERLTVTGRTASDIKKAGKGLINPRKYEDSNLYSLPLKGTFTDWGIHKNKILGSIAHYNVMIAKDKEGKKYEYSVSAIQKMLNRTIKKASKGILTRIGGDSKWKDHFKLEGAKPINPDFMGDQSKIIESLLDKNFEIEEITGFTAKFTDKEEEQEVLLKNGVILTLV